MHDCYIITMIRSTISDVIVIIGVEAAIVLVVGIALVVLLAAVFTVLAVGVNKYVNSKRYIYLLHAWIITLVVIENTFTKLITSLVIRANLFIH